MKISCNNCMIPIVFYQINLMWWTHFPFFEKIQYIFLCFCLSIYLPVLWHAGAEERSIQAQNTISISRRCYQRLAGAWWLTDHWGRKWFEHETLSSLYLHWRKYNLEHWLLSLLENICWVLRKMASQILTNIKYIGIHLAWKIADRGK